MEISIVRLQDYSTWDESVAGFQGGIFMTSWWLNNLSGDSVKPVLLNFSSGNSIVAVAGGIELPVAKGGGMQLLFYSGIAARTNDIALTGKCRQALLDYALRNRYMRITMKAYDQLSYVDSGIKQFRKYDRMEYIFRLDRDKKMMIDRFDRDVRRRVRKARREGMEFKRSYSGELTDTLFSLMNETYNIRQAKGYGNYAWFYIPFFNRDEIIRLVNKKNASFFYAEMEGRILSIQLVVAWQKQAYGVFMGTALDGYKAGAPSFLFHEIIFHLRERSFLYYNIGGVQRNPGHRGLKTFKDTLGAEPVFSSEESTNFLIAPLSFYNPLLNLKRYVQNSRIIPGRIRKIVILLIDLVLRKRDQF
jgi:hypothetical protein